MKTTSITANSCTKSVCCTVVSLDFYKRKRKIKKKSLFKKYFSFVILIMKQTLPISVWTTDTPAVVFTLQKKKKCGSYCIEYLKRRFICNSATYGLLFGTANRDVHTENRYRLFAEKLRIANREHCHYLCVLAIREYAIRIYMHTDGLDGTRK